jgi:hypothetical protein
MPLLLASCSPKGSSIDPERFKTEGFEIVSISVPMFASGILSTFLEVESRLPNGTDATLFIPYFGKYQIRWEVGYTCLADVRVGYIAGDAHSPSESPINPKIRHFITDDIKCSVSD